MAHSRRMNASPRRRACPAGSPSQETAHLACPGLLREATHFMRRLWWCCLLLLPACAPCCHPSGTRILITIDGGTCTAVTNTCDGWFRTASTAPTECPLELSCAETTCTTDLDCAQARECGLLMTCGSVTVPCVSGRCSAPAIPLLPCLDCSGTTPCPDGSTCIGGQCVLPGVSDLRARCEASQCGTACTTPACLSFGDGGARCGAGDLHCRVVDGGG